MRRFADTPLTPGIDLDADRLSAYVAVHPTPDDRREQTRTTAAVHQVQAALTEFRQVTLGEELGHAFGDAASSAHQLGAPVESSAR